MNKGKDDEESSKWVAGKKELKRKLRVRKSNRRRHVRKMKIFITGKVGWPT